jgi:hypothetical protein
VKNGRRKGIKKRDMTRDNKRKSSIIREMDGLMRRYTDDIDRQMDG